MIDTILMDSLFEIENFETVRNAINEYASEAEGYKLKKKDNACRDTGKKIVVYETKAFVRLGFTKVKIVKNYNDFEFNKYHLQLVYKPAQAIYPDDLYALSTERDLQKAVEIANTFIGCLNTFMPLDFQLLPINYWKIVRIDYAFQFSTKYYDMYHYIFQMADVPENAKRYRTSLHYSNSSTNINFYDKTNQLIEKGLLPSDVEYNEHVIRLEVQCRKKYLSRLKSKYFADAEYLTINQLWNSYFSYNVIKHKLLKLFGIGNFYVYGKAEKIIEEKGGLKSKKEWLLRLLKLSVHDNLQKIYNDFDKKYGRKQGYAKKQLRRELSMLNINTLLLPNCSPVTELRNPLVELKKVMERSAYYEKE